MEPPPRFISAPSRGRGAREIAEAKPIIHDLDAQRCQYCGATDTEIQLEHINPVSSQGINDPRNFISACAACNQAKADRPVTEFLESRDDVIDDVAELPIHGDLILETAALPKPYREVRQSTIIEFRRDSRFSGADAYKELEMAFRRNLWETDFGYWLSLRFPRVPGQARVTIPIIDTFLNDLSAPIFEFLLELAMSASTRHLLDDMLYYRVHEGQSALEAVETALEYAELDKLKQKWNNTFGTSRLFDLSPALFLTSSETRNNPVRKRELHLLDVHDFRNAVGHLGGKVNGFEIRLESGNPGSAVPIRIVEVHPNFAEAVLLEEQYEPAAIKYAKERVISVIREFDGVF